MKMKNTTVLILAVIISFGLGYLVKTITIDDSDHEIPAAIENTTALSRVTGIGGVFFYSENPTELKEWYRVHLGFDTDRFGARFEWADAANNNRKESIQWSTFSSTVEYFSPSAKDFMINYRVEDLDNLVEILQQENITFVDSIATYEYGKFVHIMDIDGNKIELYEPNYEYGVGDD